MIIRLSNKISSLNLNSRQFFAFFAAYFVLLGFLSIILAMAGIFYASIFEAYLVLGTMTLIVIYFKNKATIKFEKSFYLILAISILSVALFSYYTNPTIFSGRDQGSLSEAAIRLSQNHTLEFSFSASKAFFDIYPAPKCNKYNSILKSIIDLKSEFWCGTRGHGKALNFPGFSYASDGNLITQFPSGYVSWLAAFFSIFGLKGLVIANGVSFFIFLLSFYFIVRNFLEKTPAFLTFLLALTSFVFSWFFKFTLSENLALMLLWFGSLEFYFFMKDKKRLDLGLAFLALGLLLFVRIEGLAFLFMAFLILFFKNRKEKRKLRETMGERNLIIILSIVFLYLINIAVNQAFYLSFAKDIFHSFFQSGNGDSAGNFLPESFFSLKVLSAYAILNLIIFGLLEIIYLLKNKKFEKLIPLFIMIPSFIYLIDPHISNDHPWMLRRFIFSIIPISILYGTLFLNKFLKRAYLFYTFGVLLLVANLFLTIRYITFKPNENLLPQIEKLSAFFKDSDLVLIDREATGDGFAMMSGPMNFLFHKQAVYFFNPKDLEKINRDNFSNVYLIVPDKNLGFYQSSGLLSRTTPRKDYSIEMPALNVIMNKDIGYKTPVILPQREMLLTHGKIYLLNK
jgi:hypothetical protein